jgi:AcrR family transcriptional regulator
MDIPIPSPSPLEAVWRAAPIPAGREGLTRARIVGAAIALADAEGLGAVSMSRVAKALGFTTMSLYRHVASKDELLLHMQDEAVGPPPAAVDDGDWRGALERWAWETVTRLRAHPWILAVLPQLGPPATPHQLAWLERGLRALRDVPLREHEKLFVLLSVNAHTFGDLTFHATGEGVAAGPDVYAEVFSRHLDPERFPALLTAAAAGAFAEGPDPDAERDEMFAFGLERLLDGVARLVDERTAG